MRLSHIPLRLTTGAFILNAGLGKRDLDKDSAAGMQAMAARFIRRSAGSTRDVREDAQLRGNDSGCGTSGTLRAGRPAGVGFGIFPDPCSLGVLTTDVDDAAGGWLTLE
jgi:hypothetical protein